MKHLLAATLAGAALMLGGCAGNALRVEAASEVKTKADRFVADANAALEEAKARRLRANAAVVASDPSCEPLAVIVVQTRTRRGKGRVPLCAPSIAPKLGYDLQTLELRPISEEALKPTILLISAVGDYGAALGKIADRPDADISKELGSLAGKANSAAALAKAVLGKSVVIPDAEKLLASDQGKAATALLQFVERLANEQRKVRDINRYVAEHGDKVEQVVPQLRQQMRDWILLVSQGDAEIYQRSLVRAYASERAKMNFDQRLAFATRVNESRAESAAAPARADAIDDALDAFAAAEKLLRERLAGRFTPEEKRRMAKIAGARMVEALGLIADTVIAFGGIR
ncbi:MAG: hypothetical protein JO013_15750 [Alphaproteobacteria bacterium]|nr:hypothetical protein [Alphaproteobacteria bacterium]